MELFTLDTTSLVAVPVALGLVHVLNRLGLSKTFSPLFSILFGIGLSFLSGYGWQMAVSQGIIIGLSASGLWSGAKKTLS